jgi:hypothetical protein
LPQPSTKLPPWRPRRERLRSVGGVAESTGIAEARKFLLNDHTQILLQQGKVAYPTDESLEVVQSGQFTFRRNKWQILGWKGLALLVPVPIAKMIHDFLVTGILCHDHQYTWTIRNVCEIFRIGQYVALFRFNKAAINHELLGGGQSTQNLFLTVEQQKVIFAELDKKLTEDDEYISIMFIIGPAQDWGVDSVTSEVFPEALVDGNH